MMGRGNTGPVYPWFGQDIRNGIPLAIEHYALLHRLWREDVVDWQGRFRTPLTGFTSTPRPLDGIPPFVWHGSIRSPGDRGAGRVLRRRLLPQQHLLAVRSRRGGWSTSTAGGSSTTATARPTRRSSASAGRSSCAPNSQAAIREFRPYFDHAPVYGGGPSLEDYMAQTPLTVGSPQQVIDRTLGFREIVGDYQRQLFLIDHAGLPLKVVLEQLEMLGTGSCRCSAASSRRSGRRTCPRRRPTRASSSPRLGRHGRRRAATTTADDRDVTSEPVARRGARQRRMTAPTVVVSAGLSQPSSTRLLADRLAASTTAALADAGIDDRNRGHRAPRPRARVDHLLTGFPSPDLRAAIDTCWPPTGSSPSAPSSTRPTAACSSCSSTSSS